MNRLPQVKQNKIFTKGDFLIMAVALIVIIAIFIFSIRPMVTGSTVEIYESGELVHTINLSKNESYFYEVASGNNTITVKDGVAYIEDSTCSDQLCVKIGAIKDSGKQIVCLPNRLRVVITGEGEIDAIS